MWPHRVTRHTSVDSPIPAVLSPASLPLWLLPLWRSVTLTPEDRVARVAYRRCPRSLREISRTGWNIKCAILLELLCIFAEVTSDYVFQHRFVCLNVAAVEVQSNLHVNVPMVVCRVVTSCEFIADDGGRMFFRNVGTHLQLHTASQPRDSPWTSSPTWEPHISCNL
jgi:hypothetical protein